jgi:hypothetical protein
MKLTSIVKFRIVILLALSVGEVFGLLHFYGQSEFTSFILFSLGGIMLIVPLLWLEVMRRFKVNYYQLVLIPIAILGITNSWNHGDRAFGWAWILILLLDITVTLILILKSITDQGGRA